MLASNHNLLNVYQFIMFN